jgi:hypothetical protein
VVDVVVLLLVVAGLPLVVVAEADPDHALGKPFNYSFATNIRA